jgi:hypothetical protein
MLISLTPNVTVLPPEKIEMGKDSFWTYPVLTLLAVLCDGWSVNIRYWLAVVAGCSGWL